MAVVQAWYPAPEGQGRSASRRGMSAHLCLSISVTDGAQRAHVMPRRVGRVSIPDVDHHHQTLVHEHVCLQGALRLNPSGHKPTLRSSTAVIPEGMAFGKAALVCHCACIRWSGVDSPTPAEQCLDAAL